MKKYLALVLLVGLGMAFAPSCKKEKKHAPKKVHKTHVKKHKKGGVKVQGLHHCLRPHRGGGYLGPTVPPSSKNCKERGLVFKNGKCVKKAGSRQKPKVTTGIFKHW
ncbi:hypothetical protein HN446_02015 [bacterium]|jgi:hypothetical protein|nr:hypothetical protein [bacterium]